MGNTLPPVLPSSSSSSKMSPPLKSMFSKDIENATTSISRLGKASQTPVTSVGRLGQQNKKQLAGSDDFYNKDSDDIRYGYVRGLIRARKAKEQAEQKQKQAVGSSASVYKLPIPTGAGFRRRGGPTSLDRRMYEMVRKNPASFKNLSAKDQQYFLNLMQTHAKSVRTGAPLGWSVKRNIKQQLERDRQAGKISFQDKNDFKKFVDQL